MARASRRAKNLFIGHNAGHPEVEGTMGQYSKPEGDVPLSRRGRLDAECQNEGKLFP